MNLPFTHMLFIIIQKTNIALPVSTKTNNLWHIVQKTGVQHYMKLTNELTL